MVTTTRVLVFNLVWALKSKIKRVVSDVSGSERSSTKLLLQLPHGKSKRGLEVTTSQDLSAQRQQLRAELRHERELACLTQKEVARAMDWSPSKMLRIETGAVGISTTDLRALLSYYNVKDKRETEELVNLARAARSRKNSL